ncbi:MAG TPA: hypothetical protein VGD80_17790, partial [Kofleriaceae bacterium]
MTRLAVALVLVVVLAAPAVAAPLRVTVVEVAGGMAYLDKGSSDGVVRGTRVAFGGQTAVVVEVTAGSAVIELGSFALAVGSTGTADITPPSSSVPRLPRPRPVEAFRGQWPAPELPASTQSPRPVAL